ncbi:MAG TPA: flagellar M-ring protein FliF [Bacteroidales bacterium]|nr:flagellar M-ring protein FliF [Bacteroidales bacterium]
MPETINQMSEQLTEKWNGFEKSHKIKIIVIALIVIAIMAIFVVLFNRPKMVVLMNNLESKQASGVAGVLDGESIPYQLKNDGSTILVDKKNANKAKLILAREDVPKGRFNFDDALSNTMSTTESEKRMKHLKADENEIANTLELIDSIEHAEVNLVIPNEDNSFLESKQKATAGVILELSNPLTNKQINGVANFVAMSVKNLDKQDINIIDTQGNNLYIGEQAELEGFYSRQQEQKIFAEQDLKNKVADLMSKMYDDVRVSPNLVFNYDQYVETKEKYESPIEDSNKGIVTEDRTSEYSATNNQTGLEPGVVPNAGEIPTYGIGGNETGESKGNSKEAIYAVDKTVSSTTKEVGKIDTNESSIAIHAFRNKTYKQEEIEKRLPEGQTWEEFKELNKEQQQLPIDEMLIDSIQKATGLQNVAIHSFENPVFLDTEVFKMSVQNYIPYILLVLFLLALGFGIYKFTSPKEIVELDPELSVEEMLQSAKELQAPPLDDIAYGEDLEVKRHIDKFVDEEPEAVASLLRNWLADDEWE